MKASCASRSSRVRRERERRGPRPRSRCTGMQQRRLRRGFRREFEPRLVAADELDIDRSQQPAIEQRAMLLAPGKIDAVALAQCIEAARRARMLAPRQRQRVDHAVPTQQWTAEALKFGVEEGEVEGGVVHHEHGALDELEHVVGELMKARLGGQELDGQPVHLVRRVRHVAIGVDMAVPHASGRDAVDQLDAADLDDAMSGPRVETRGFRIENDLAQSARFPLSVLVRDGACPSRGLCGLRAIRESYRSAACMSARVVPLSTT